MDINAITTIIGSLGFPIAACIYMIYSMDKERERTDSTLKELADVIQNNTEVLIRLTERLGLREDK